MHCSRYYLTRDGSCVICGKINFDRTSKLRLYRLPFDPDRTRVWVKALGIKSLLRLPLERLHFTKFVCSLHFSPLCVNTKGALHKVAIPTLNLPYPPLPDKLLVGFPPQGFTHKDINSVPKKMNVNTTIDADIPLMNCIETVMDIRDRNISADTPVEKQMAQPNNCVISNVEHVTLCLEGVPRNSNNAFPVPLMNCTQTVMQSRVGANVYEAPRTFTSRSKKYGKCYSKGSSLNKITKQRKVVESLNTINFVINPMKKSETNTDNTLYTPTVKVMEVTSDGSHCTPANVEVLSRNIKRLYDIALLTERPTTFDTPLMNCTETIFKHGKISFDKKPNDSVKTIDIPLMQCLKTLE